MARWQYQRYVAPLANNNLVPAEPWMGQQPALVPAKATLPVAVIASTVFAFVPIVVPVETTRSAPSDSGVVTERQLQYQPIAFPLVIEAAPTAPDLSWRPIIADLILGPPELGADCQPYYGAAAFTDDHREDAARLSVFPARVWPKPGLLSAAQQFIAWHTETPEPPPEHKIGASDSGVIWNRQVQYQSIALSFETTAAATPAQPYHQPELPVRPRVLGWALPTTFFTPRHEDSEGSTLGWRPAYPDRIPARERRWTFPSVVGMPPPDAIQTGWQGVYPAWVARRAMPIRPALFFTPAHEAREGNALDWTARYPDWLPPIRRPAGGLSFSPSPIAQPEAPQQPYHQPEFPVQPRRVGWALPWLAFVQSQDSLHTGWIGNYPAWIASRAMPVRPSLAFTPAHEATEGNSLAWWPRYPDWFPPITRPEGGLKFHSVPIPNADAPAQPYHQPEIPVPVQRRMWTAPWLAFVNSPDSIHTGWQGSYPAWIDRKAMPVRPSLAFTPAHEATEGNLLGWWPRYPDWMPPIKRPEGRLSINIFPLAQPEAPQQPYHQPEWPVQPKRVGWALPWAAWVPQHNPTEGNLLGWTPRYPDWIARLRPTATGMVAGPVSFRISPEQPYQPPMLPVQRVVRWTYQFLALPPYAALPIQPWEQWPEPVRRRLVVATGFFAWHPQTTAAVPELPWVESPTPVRRRLLTPTQFAWSTFTPPAPLLPWIDLGILIRPPKRVILEGESWSTFTPPVPDQFHTAPPDPVRLVPRFTQTEFAWYPLTAVTAPEMPPTFDSRPVWSKQWHPSLQTESRGPVFPVPTNIIQRVVGIVGSLLEQSSGSYIATLRDPEGRILPGSILDTLRLTLWTVNRDNTISIVNSRSHQPCLNINNVRVYDSLQTTADGRRFNLRWEIQPADTTMVDATLGFERHLMLWEYTWSAGSGKHEATFVVHNLSQVS